MVRLRRAQGGRSSTKAGCRGRGGYMGGRRPGMACWGRGGMTVTLAWRGRGGRRWWHLRGEEDGGQRRIIEEDEEVRVEVEEAFYIAG
jgi:hypothetical protein